MTNLTTTKAKEQLTALVRKAHTLGEKFVITHRGEKYGILMDAEEYEGLMETIDILKNSRTAKDIAQSLKEVKEGKWEKSSSFTLTVNDSTSTAPSSLITLVSASKILETLTETTS